jgi:hypothetical protein
LVTNGDDQVEIVAVVGGALGAHSVAAVGLGLESVGLKRADQAVVCDRHQAQVPSEFAIRYTFQACEVSPEAG